MPKVTTIEGIPIDVTNVPFINPTITPDKMLHIKANKTLFVV